MTSEAIYSSTVWSSVDETQAKYHVFAPQTRFKWPVVVLKKLNRKNGMKCRFRQFPFFTTIKNVSLISKNGL